MCSACLRLGSRIPIWEFPVLAIWDSILSPHPSLQPPKCPLSFRDGEARGAAKGKMATVGKGDSAHSVPRYEGVPRRPGRRVTTQVTWVASLLTQSPRPSLSCCPSCCIIGHARLTETPQEALPPSCCLQQGCSFLCAPVTSPSWVPGCGFMPLPHPITSGFRPGGCGGLCIHMDSRLPAASHFMISPSAMILPLTPAAAI